VPTEIIECASVGNYDQWALGAGGDKVVAVNSPHDDNTSFISEHTSGQKQSYAIDSMAGDADEIISVSPFFRAAGVGTNPKSMRALLRLGGSDSVGPTKTTTDTPFTDYQDAVSRPGGGDWAVADIASLEIGVEQTATSDPESNRCTTIRVTVSYQEPQQGGSIVLAKWLLPLIGAASHGLLRREVVGLTRALKIRPSTEADFCRILEAFRVRPRFVFIGR
jgi:hypothetical protein